jgi:putative DNA primase/helicase
VYAILSESVRRREAFVKAASWIKALNITSDENNDHACNERFFSLRLKKMGYERTRTADARYWTDIGLKAAAS